LKHAVVTLQERAEANFQDYL